MDSCEQTHIELSAALAEGHLHLPPELINHLNCCANCRQVWQEMRLTWGALDQLPEQKPPLSLLEMTRARIHAELTRERESAASSDVGRAAYLSAGLGVLLSLLSVWVLRQKNDLSAFSAQLLLGVGATWTALYAGAVLLAMRDVPRFGIALRWVGIAGLLATGLSLALAGTCSLGGALDYCRMRPDIQQLFGGFHNQILYFLMGSLYSLVPLLIATAVIGPKAPRHPLALGLMAGGLFIILTLPGILLQCGAFSIGLSLSLIFGSVVGSLAGGSIGSVAGAFIYRRLRPLRAT